MGARSLVGDANLVDKRLARPLSGSVTYELNVLAADVGDVVASIGGWLFDRSSAGWGVNVWLHGIHDLRPLRILGVSSRELDQWLSGDCRGEQRGAGLAVASDLRGTDERIETEVRDALRSGDTEVVQWGATESAERVELVDYRLSAAARIFKGHAMAAALLANAPVGASETMWCPSADARIA